MASENLKISTIVKHSNAFVCVSIIAIVSVLMHWRIFPLDLMGVHVWRQTETQTVIQNFYEESMNIINPKINNRGDGDGIFRMEFPLMQWVFALFYKVFGNHLIITRILSFIIGMFSLAGIYKLCNVVFNNKWIAIIAAWAFNFSPVFYYYTLNPLPDNAAMCMTIWASFWFFKWQNTNKSSHLIYYGLFLCMASLIKLPYILYGSLFAGQFIYKAIVSRTNLMQLCKNAILLIVLLVPAIAWYAWVIRGWDGNGIVGGMLDNKASISVLLNILRHNIISTLPESLVNYAACLFFVFGIVHFFRHKKFKNKAFAPLLATLIMLTVYFLFELNMIALVHDYYLMPFLPLIFLIVAYGAWNLYCQKSKFLKYFTLVLIFALPITAYLRINTRWKPSAPGFNVDLLTHKTQLQQAVPDNALCIVGHDQSGFIFLYYIHKKGWTYNEAWFNEKEMEAWLNKGAKYFYSDSRKIEERENIKRFIGKKITEQGSIIVYELKRQ